MSFFSKLFKEANAKNIITLFHAPKSQSSIRALTILKQAQANSVATATEDQASSHTTQSKAERTEFELDVEEGTPTSDQLRIILQYLGASNAGKVVEGASDEEEAQRKLRTGAESFQRPLTVDWHAGRAVIGDNESEILKLVKAIPKETKSV
ncbi:hypothetical protein K490DRAFT_60176 [Saccharata proteae CBS 121410]|uniref:DUF1687-domain-containing protein n=1 Tax=Saccharata proteae CBS 121410 TaxID=1314787 RepID=A0A9P4LTI2_9PEZI|nr:hypothetical protein K490DRAFT_60176 [Saccharata proteae CBS 121410]